MTLERTEPVELVNMCMIVDEKTQQVLVQDKEDVAWKFGHSFPGGHVQAGESVATAMVREVKEETGLTVTNLEACGLVEWFAADLSYRKIGFLYKTSNFSGELKQSSEGRNYWLPISHLTRENTAESLLEMLTIFNQPNVVEGVSRKMNGPLKLPD